jgi:TolB protein
VSCKVAYDGDDGFLWAVTPDGETRERLDRLTHLGTVDYSPDGSRLAVVRGGQLVILSRAGKVLHRVLLDQKKNALLGWPVWAPNSRDLALTAQDGPPLRSAIIVVAADGSGLRTITDRLGDISDPSWAPDGQKLVFSYTRDELPNYALYVVRRDGTGLRRLRIAVPDAEHPDWSPDGTQILFDIEGDGIAIVDTVGSHLHRVAGTAEGGDAQWSPDGRHIAFDYGFDPPIEVYVVDRDGTGRRRLTHARSNSLWDTGNTLETWLCPPPASP